MLTAAPMDSCVVPHRSTNRAVLWLTAQIGRDAVLSESYGRRHQGDPRSAYILSKTCKPDTSPHTPALNKNKKTRKINYNKNSARFAGKVRGGPQAPPLTLTPTSKVKSTGPKVVGIRKSKSNRPALKSTRPKERKVQPEGRTNL